MSRIDLLRERLQVHGVDCLAVIPGANLRYLTGLAIDLHERAFILFIPAAGEPLCVIPSLEVSKWEAEVPFNTRLFAWSDSDGPDQAMAEAARAMGIVGSLAVEHLNMRLMEFDLIRRYLPHAEITEAEKILGALRMCKAAEEIAAIRRAIEITEAALEEVVLSVRPGQTERAVAARLRNALLERGGEGISFGPIVLAGERSALPHGDPGERALAEGDLLLFDLGTSSAGYHSDLTRTFFIGRKPDERVRSIYEAVLSANTAAREAVRPGIAVQDVHRAAEEKLIQAGHRDLIRHRTGHGLGLEIHEPPSVMEGNTATLSVGEVFTTEPGLYQEGWGGVRIEDDVLVTKDGSETLTTFGRELRCIGVHRDLPDG